jgi:hypothetical protein
MPLFPTNGDKALVTLGGGVESRKVKAARK